MISAKKAIWTPALLLVLSLQSSNQVMFADPATQDPTPPKSPSTAKAKEIVCAEGLRQMGGALSKMQRAAADLVGEATRQDYISVGDPDVVGTIIIPAIPEPSGMMAVGPYLPMRKAWVDLYLDQIGKLIPIYAKETDALDFPQGLKSDADAILVQMRPLFESARGHYMNILGLTQNVPQMDNSRVGDESVMLHDDLKKIDDLRKQVFKLLKDFEKNNKGQGKV